MHHPLGAICPVSQLGRFALHPALCSTSLNRGRGAVNPARKGVGQHAIFLMPSTNACMFMRWHWLAMQSPAGLLPPHPCSCWHAPGAKCPRTAAGSLKLPRTCWHIPCASSFVPAHIQAAHMQGADSLDMSSALRIGPFCKASMMRPVHSNSMWSCREYRALAHAYYKCQIPMFASVSRTCQCQSPSCQNIPRAAHHCCWAAASTSSKPSTSPENAKAVTLLCIAFSGALMPVSACSAALSSSLLRPSPSVPSKLIRASRESLPA